MKNYLYSQSQPTTHVATYKRTNGNNNPVFSPLFPLRLTTNTIYSILDSVATDASSPKNMRQ